MNYFKTLFAGCLLVLSILQNPFAQTTEISPFDFGKMWTFENPPKAWFSKAYDFNPETKWWDDVRMASLRFATWCSASFVSPDGLIVTNHHCSRDVALQVQQPGEAFEAEGFYATTQITERRVPGLFVEQLVKLTDVSGEVIAIAETLDNNLDYLQNRQEALEQIKIKYAQLPEWEGLRIQAVNYYSGGKFSLYGYKRFDDIRLVLIPELDLGFFGGDPDNFTYPRYNLDFTFWRAYDENGNPFNTEEYYLKFNENGIFEGEPVFAVGNPGSTERYRTVAQLEYDRDYRYPQQVKFLTNRLNLLQQQYEQYPSEQLLGLIFNLSNSLKANEGIVDGMQNPILFDRKIAMEEKIRSISDHPDYWNSLAESYNQLKPHAWALNHLGPNGLRGAALLLLHQLNDLESQIRNNASEEEINTIINEIVSMSDILEMEDQEVYLIVLLIEIAEDIYPGDISLQKILKGKSIDAYVNWLYANTHFIHADSSRQLLSKRDSLLYSKDPLLEASRILVPKYNAAVQAFQSTAPVRRNLEAKIANEVFKVYGSDLPPDATFTLRIADGIVTGYNYNGTTAPYKTTYYGLYDRYFSNDSESPWSLPEKWRNPDPALLQSPINFVSTIDITGGNSGSPVINRKKEFVGLVFDGNIESLPGNFIFDEEYNRSISVHAGGILAAMQYIYGAERIVNELMKSEESQGMDKE